MTSQEFQAILNGFGAFSSALIAVSWVLIYFVQLQEDARRFVLSFGLGVGLCLLGIYFLLLTFTRFVE
jgi:hypothetical protein